MAMTTEKLLKKKNVEGDKKNHVIVCAVVEKETKFTFFTAMGRAELWKDVGVISSCCFVSLLYILIKSNKTKKL